MTVTIKKIGGSVAVVIPKAVAQEMQLSEGTTLSISTNKDSIVMQRQGRRPRRTISAIVAGINSASYRRRNRENLADPPVGKEIW
jgi:antitoxin component of MazEF toxin-antitoxin module